MMKLVVLSCVLAAASASVVGISPLAYSGLGYPGLLPYSAGVLPYGAGVLPYGAGVLPYSAAVLPYSSNYRGPLSLAPGQPANILGADGRPLDTLEVNLDKLEKAASGVHLLKKRSVVAPWISPLTYSAAYGYPAPLAYSAPLWAPYSGNYRGPLSLAPGQPANILGADGRPLDTLEVNADKLEKAAAGVHILKKRSVALASPLTIASGPLIAPAPYARFASLSPITPIGPYSPYAALPYAAYWK